MMLKLNQIEMKYPKSSHLILNDINIQLNVGEFQAVMGESGSGKSTLLAIMSGLLRPSEGEVIYNEDNIYKMSEYKLAKLHENKICYVPQSNILLKRYCIWENIIVPYMLGCSVKEELLKERAYENLRKLGIEDLANRFPYELSGGELKRVSLARAMLMEPDIVIADEPTSGLDKNTGEIIFQYLFEYTIKEKAVFVATHDENILNYSNTVFGLEKGNIKKRQS